MASDDDRPRRAGRLRKPTGDEAANPETLFRANSVLALSHSAGAPSSAAEERVVALVDGFRPVARLRSKSGLSASAFRGALRDLADAGALIVVGVIEEAELELSRPAGEALDGISRGEGDGHTMPRGGDGIPPPVMAEIQRMIDEEQLARADESFDDTTDVVPLPGVSRLPD